MKDSIEAGEFETIQRVRAKTAIELAVIRQRVNDAAVSTARRLYAASINDGEMPDPREIADQAFEQTTAKLNELLSGE